jgi:bile acid:Na+ symporter, BASS family
MQLLTRLFPLLAVAAGAIAYFMPGVFVPYAWAIVPLLVVIMFSMGLTLTVDDFRRVARQPAAVGLGLLMQYTIMPVAALIIGFAMSLSPELLTGLVVVGSCPGGTASNVICYLARANVALSVTLTFASTLVAVAATPALTWILLDQYVPVDIAGMLGSMIQIVLLPVILGVALNHAFSHYIGKLKPFLPVVAIVAILLAIAIIVALNQPHLAGAALVVLAAVILHNLLGFAGGYAIPYWLGFDRLTCRTLSIEVGMQNSGLGVALAIKHFAPLAALPGALFSIWHNIGGAVLAGYWAARPIEPPSEPEAIQ